MKLYHLPFLLILLVTSCNDEVETQAQLTAKKLNKDIAANVAVIRQISVVNINDGSEIFSGTSYVITSGGFIEITSDTQKLTFNLGELKSYGLYSESLVLYY